MPYRMPLSAFVRGLSVVLVCLLAIGLLAAPSAGAETPSPTPASSASPTAPETPSPTPTKPDITPTPKPAASKDAADDACATASLAQWGATLPISADRGAGTSECFLVTTGAFGMYAWRYVQQSPNWNASLTVYDATGAQVHNASGWSGFGTVQLLAGQQYRLEISGSAGSNPAGYQLGLFELAGSGGCATAASTAFGTTPIAGAFADGTELGCRELTDPAGSLLRVDTQSTDSSVSATVFDAKGAAACSWIVYDTAVDCRLTGTAPFRLVTRSTTGADAVPAAYKVWADNVTSAQGCTSSSLTSWNALPELTATRAANSADCAVVTGGSFGQYVLRLTQQNGNWSARIQLYEPNGNRVHDTTASYSTPELKAGLNYRIVVSGDPSGYPAGYAVVLAQVNGSPGCATVTSTAWNSIGTAISLPTGQELDCRQFGDAQGSMLRVKLGSTSLYAEVYNAAGASICTLAGWNDAADCRMTGTAPYRIVTRSGSSGAEHDPAGGTLWAYNIASTTGCQTGPLGSWLQPLPVSVDRSDHAADCALVTTDTFGEYLLRYAQDNGNWSGAVTIYEPTGARVYSSSGTAYTSIQLKAGTTYRVLVTGDPNGYPPAVHLGLFRITGGGSCPLLTDVGWAAPATTFAYAAGPELGCRQLPGSSGTALRITMPPNSDGQWLRGVVYDAAGTQLCDTAFSGSGVTCTLTGSAPYRLITRTGYSNGDAQPGTYQTWVNDFGTTAGCGSVDSTVAVSAPPAIGALVPGTSSSCWTVGLTREDRAWLSLVPATSAGLHATVFGGAGQSLCSLTGGTGHANCALTEAGPYKLLVTGPAGDDSGYRVALRRLNNPSGCQRADGVASGIAELRGDVGDSDQVACVRFAEAVGDQMNFTAVNPAVAGDPPQNLDVYGPNGDLVCSPRPWQSSPHCTFLAAGDQTAVVSAGSYPGRFVLSSSCVNPACGPEVFTLAGVTPQRAGAAKATTITVQGKALATSQTVQLVHGTTRITGQPLAVSADGRQLQVAFDLSTAPLGLYDVTVSSPTDGTLRATAALTVEGVRPAHIETGLVTLGRFVANRPQTVSVTVKNTGNVDALGTPLYLDGLPAGSVVTPRFDLVGANAADGPIRPVDWVPDRSTYTGSNGRLGVPLFVGRIPAGGSHQYDFTVTVPVGENYNLSALSSNCMVASTPEADTFGSGGCTDAAIDLVTGLLVDSSCKALAVSAGVEITRNVANHAPPFAVTSQSDMFWSALGAVECVSQFLGPAGKVLSMVLGGISQVKDIVEVGQKCFGGASAAQTSVASLDPNELVGPTGGGAAHAVTTDRVHTFAVYFENAKTATAPAQEVRVTDQLNPAQYDLSTLRFGAVQFGTTRWTPASESTTIDHVLDLGGNTGLQLDMQASADAQGRVEWDLRTEDIVTGALPEDPMKGFLPPNVDGTQGQGVLYFTVQPKHVADGTVLSSHADIVFDLNPPIATNIWKNLVDNTAPAAKATAPAAVTSRTFTVSWSGSDATSGIKSYDVLVATDSGPYTTWKQGVAAGSAVYTGTAGHVYRISAVAHDVAGNVSLLPPTPHATTAVRDATALTAGSATTIKYGASLVLSTRAKDVNTGAVLARLPVVLYKRSSSTAAWTKVATLTTSTAGVASSTQAPKGYTQFQWRYAGNAAHAAVNSAVQVVSVGQTVSARATASSVVRGTTVKVYGTVGPTVTNQIVYLQRLSGTTWRNLTSARLIRQRLPSGVTTTGFVLSVKPSPAGTYRYRVYKPAVTGLLTGYSATLTVKAR